MLLSVSSRNVELTILGQKYIVKSEQDEAQLKEVARFVDARLSELTRGGRLTSVRVAVVGALNIANEYYLFRRHMEDVLAKLEERSEHLVELVEKPESQ